MFDVVVIGGGLIGASATRHLCKAGLSVAVIAPPEPDSPISHRGPFGAYYDVSRSSRTLYVDPVELELSRRAQAANPEIEDHSNEKVFFGEGHLLVAKREDYEELFTLFEDPSHSHLAEILDAEGLRKKWPELCFPPDYLGLYELDCTGILNPRKLVEAQLSAVTSYGGKIFSSAAKNLEIKNNCFIELEDGSVLEANKVLISAGAWSNSSGLLPRPLALRMKTETVLLAEVDSDESERLAKLPAMHYEISDAAAADIYAVPPQVYPDGRTLIKWGANTLADTWIEDAESINHWYRQGDSDQIIDSVKASMERTYPEIKVKDWHTNRCVITYTTHGLPYIDSLVDNQVYVAIGGNGRSAKWADPLGALAASLTIANHWVDPLPASRFEAVFDNQPTNWVGRRLLKQRNCALGGT